MFERIKMEMAALRAERAKRDRRRKRRPGFWMTVRNIICWPLDLIVAINRWVWNLICRFFRWLWRVICGINVIGLLNVLLLIAIIVLCSMLVIDIINSRRKPVVIVTDPVPASRISNAIEVPVIAEPTTKPVSASVAESSVRGQSLPRTGRLPIVRTRAHKMTAEPIRVVNARRDIVAEQQTAKIDNRMYGDIIIDSRGAATMLQNGTEINGNLYLQNLRKYVLPCDIKITGNMFIRDVNMLQFCGDFDISGNIYVTPSSSFGPIPRSAHLGGQVIL